LDVICRRITYCGSSNYHRIYEYRGTPTLWEEGLFWILIGIVWE
jgi:hypothetical protein